MLWLLLFSLGSLLSVSLVLGLLFRLAALLLSLLFRRGLTCSSVVRLVSMRSSVLLSLRLVFFRLLLSVLVVVRLLPVRWRLFVLWRRLVGCGFRSRPLPVLLVLYRLLRLLVVSAVRVLGRGLPWLLLSAPVFLALSSVRLAFLLVGACLPFLGVLVGSVVLLRSVVRLRFSCRCSSCRC